MEGERGQERRRGRDIKFNMYSSIEPINYASADHFLSVRTTFVSIATCTCIDPGVNMLSVEECRNELLCLHSGCLN